MTLTSTSIHHGGSIPETYSDYGQRMSPDLSWSGVPPSAQSLVLVMEDPDVELPNPFVHWVLYNLPSSITTLPEAQPAAPRLPDLGGALQGRNSDGTIGYLGPRPPAGDQPHRYFFQLFAVDRMLELEPGVLRDDVLDAMAGHVVGAGELVGTFKAPAAGS